MSSADYVLNKLLLELFFQKVQSKSVHCMCLCASPFFALKGLNQYLSQNLKYISLVLEAGNQCKENVMPNSASNNRALFLATQQSKEINSGLIDVHANLREPACPSCVLQKFKKGVTAVIDNRIIQKALDANFPIDLPSLLLRRYWLDNVSRLTDWDRQLIQNYICNSFHDVFYTIDNVKSETDILHQSTSSDITQALLKIAAQQSAERNFFSLQQWFGYYLDMAHECEPNIINQLRFTRHYINAHGEKRFHITAYKMNYVIYGGWRRNEASKPSFELIELLNSTLGFENLYLHKIQDPSQLKKTAVLLKHFRKMVIRSGGKEVLLADRPEMSDFGTSAYVRDVITPSMLGL